MKKPILIFFLIVFFVSSACSMPVETRWTAPDATITQVNVQVSAHNAKSIAATYTPTPDTTATAMPTLPPTAVLSPTPTQRVVPEGVVNIMVLGSDFRPSEGHRTDAIMLVSVNTVKQTVSVVSFPRDLYVPIPGWTTQRINTAEPHGGFDLLAATMYQNFGVKPDYYIMTDFQGFKGIIDSLGGVDVYAGSRMSDRCDLPIAQKGKCTIEPGSYHMDGKMALWYIRARYASSDLDRIRREQEVMMGIFIRLMSNGALQNLPGLYAQYKSSVTTNLNLGAMTPLLPTAATVFANRKLIRRYPLTIKEAKPFVTETGAQVLLPDYDRIEQILNEAVFN